MSATASLSTTLSSGQSARVELWFGRVGVAFGVVVALAAAAHCGILYWAQNEFSQPESIIAAQATMLERDGNLYPSLTGYPYTVNAYMPVFYLLDAGLIRLGVPPYAAGRSISAAALVGLLAVCWRIALLYSSSRHCAWMALLLCASSTLLWSWGTVGQVDTLGVFFAVAAFHQFSRYWVRSEPALPGAAALAIAALLTKQTMVAAPAAIAAALWFRNRKAALAFSGAVGGVVLALAFALNAATSGAFLTNTVYANMNPFVGERLRQHLLYLSIAAGQLVLVVAAGARRALRTDAKPLLFYLGVALCVLLATAPKIGSDSNYQIEVTVLLALGASVALNPLRFFPLLFGGSKSWITLLQAPLAIHMILNLRMTLPFLVARVAKERMFQQQVSELRPILEGGGRAISTDTNAMLRLRGRLEVEPLIYTLLVSGGRVDPGPLTQDLAAKTFPIVVLYQDVSREAALDPEIPSLPDPQIAEIRRSYRLVRHIPGPYRNGVYVYRPQ
jgi:hypothetical protein